MKVDIPDVIMLILLLLGVLLVIYIVKLATIKSSPEYVTYKDFNEYTMKMFSIVISILGLIFGNDMVIWYKLGRIEERLGIGKRSRGSPE